MFELRRVGDDDWRLWRDVRLRALADAPHAFGSTLAEWQGAGDTEVRWRQRLQAVPFNVLGAVDGGDAGQVSGTDVDDHGVSDLISLWVAPEVRGAGLADELVAAVVGWARSGGGAGVRLWVKQANDAAIHLYERHGFVTTGATEGDELEMHRAVHRAPAGRHPSRA